MLEELTQVAPDNVYVLREVGKRLAQRFDSYSASRRFVEAKSAYDRERMQDDFDYLVDKVVEEMVVFCSFYPDEHLLQRIACTKGVSHVR